MNSRSPRVVSRPRTPCRGEPPGTTYSHTIMPMKRNNGDEREEQRRRQRPRHPGKIEYTAGGEHGWWSSSTRCGRSPELATVVIPAKGRVLRATLRNIANSSMHTAFAGVTKLETAPVHTNSKAT